MYRPFFKKYGWRYIPGALLVALCSYVQTLSPLVLGDIFDLFDQTPLDKTAIMIDAVILVVIAASIFVMRYMWRNFIMGNARHMECMLREQLFDHLQSMPPSFYQTRKSGDLMAYAVNDISAIRMTFGPSLATALQGIVTGTVSIVTMITEIDPRLSLLSMAPMPFIVLIMVSMGSQIRKRFMVVQKTFAEVSDRVNENVGGIRVVKAYVQEENEIKRFEELNGRMKQASMRMVRISALMMPLVQVLFGVCFVVGIVYGANLVRSGSLSVGDFVAFNTFLTLMMGPIMSIGRIINNLQRGMASHHRLKAIMDVKSDIPQGKDEIKECKGEIEVKNLTYTFSGEKEPALKNISFKLESGKTLGIIGHTGSGKSALVGALMKFGAVPDGSIFLDGKDVNTLTLANLRSHFGCVPQDGFLFSDTIGNNIRFFEPNASKEDIDKACELADIMETIKELPQGYDTVLGERGVNLSGGQKQRIAIARAIVKKPSIYIFDDSLAAVDTKTEERIIGNLRQETNAKTAIFIAHRASVIMHADEIILLENGEIAERGTHEQLLELDGKYAQLWRIQSGKEAQEVNEYAG